MYPLSTTVHWPENQWYIAGFSEELGDEPVGRTYLSRRVVLFRDSAGVPHALSGICPHRMMPMEQGAVQGDRIACGYHGLEFDTHGVCVASPTSVATPDCALAKYAIRENGPLLWIWVGDQQVAETTPLPDQAALSIGADGWRTQCVDYALLKARYMLLIDNLFDLSHLGFVHASLLGSGGIGLEDPKIEERQGRLVVSRTMTDVPPDPYHRFLHPHIGERLSVRMETEQVGISLINAGGPAFDGASTEAPLLGHQNFIHAITPSTPTTTHYWTLMTRDFRRDDEALSQALAAQNKAVVAQDIEALEAIEGLFGSGVELPREISMKSDLGAMRARSRIIKMIREDQRTSGASERAREDA